MFNFAVGSYKSIMTFCLIKQVFKGIAKGWKINMPLCNYICMYWSVFDYMCVIDVAWIWYHCWYWFNSTVICKYVKNLNLRKFPRRIKLGCNFLDTYQPLILFTLGRNESVFPQGFLFVYMGINSIWCTSSNRNFLIICT